MSTRQKLPPRRIETINYTIINLHTNPISPSKNKKITKPQITKSHPSPLISNPTSLNHIQ